MTDNDKHAVSVLLDALDNLYDGRLAVHQLRAVLRDTKLDSAELAAEVQEAARALAGILRLDTRSDPPYDPRYKSALEVTASLRARLADLYDDIWSNARRW